MVKLCLGIDSGDPREIRQIIEWGFPVDKVTSIAKTMQGKESSVYDIAMEIRDTVGSGVPISVEAIGAPTYKMEDMDSGIFVEEALRIKEWGPDFVVKIQTIQAGFDAAKKLDGEVPINFTLVFSPHQAFLASVFGGAYASPFVGRIDYKLAGSGKKEIYSEGMDLVGEIADLFYTMDSGTKILTASIRNVSHLEKAAAYHSHLTTVPFKIFEDLYKGHGNEALSYIDKLRKSGSYTPKQPKKPSYGGAMNTKFMRDFQIELMNDGVARFLRDAESVGYTILGKK